MYSNDFSCFASTVQSAVSFNANYANFKLILHSTVFATLNQRRMLTETTVNKRND